MKYFYSLSILIFSLSKLSAQDVIYFADGTKTMGQMKEITVDKVKFKNLANPNGPIYSRNIGSARVAFNAAGNYLAFLPSKPLTDKEKSDFIGGTTKVSSDVLVDSNGTVTPVTIKDENESEILANRNGVDEKISKNKYAVLIRKNGTHQIFSTIDQAMPLLATAKPKVSNYFSQAEASKTVAATQNSVAPKAASVESTAKQEQVTSTAKQETVASTPNQEVKQEPAKQETVVSTPKQEVKKEPAKQETATAKPKLIHDDNEIAPDLAVFGNKALQKTEEFSKYLQAITSVSTNREAAKKSVNLACGLFLNEDARVEVSNVNSGTKNKYKIRDYLNRLLLKSGQYDKVIIEYANVNYATKFKKGPDGNYYGSVTFVQKFQGFVDGNLVYGDMTKRNMTIVLKHYEKAVNGENISGWDVFLDDIGVVETKKI
jgi:hypothetical protein